MIDWRLITVNAIWIVGAAIVLAAWSHRRAIPSTNREGADLQSQRSWWVISGTGGLLACIGMVMQFRWHSAIWLLPAIFAAQRVYRGLRS